MREIETIDDRPSPVARGLQIAVGAAIVLACGVFAAGVLVGRSGKASADGSSDDPLARLDLALAAEEPEAVVAEPPLTFHRSLVDPDTPTVSPSELAALGTSPSTSPTASASPGTSAAASASTTASTSASTTASTTTTPRVEHMGRGGEEEPPGAEGSPTTPAATAPATFTPEGSDGPFTLQVASFQDEQEARRTSASLRGQGFRTFIAAADVPGRGMWFRVRIGPYRAQGEVDRARRDYEERTRQPAIVVKREDPSENARHGRNRR